jgi:hypothetical protein
MEMNNRVVAHFTNGTVLKGQTWDFAPSRPTFHLTLTAGGRQIPVSLTDLKAVFFVKDFEGDSNYVHKWNLDCDVVPGKKLMVTFEDGEVLFGTTQGYHPEDTGFFLYPADPDSNNLRVFIINRSVTAVEEVQ